MSGASSRLERVAERMAREAFEERVQELTTLAEGDLDAVHDAILSVQTKARAAGTPEHIAFTLLAATWKRIADRRRASFEHDGPRPRRPA